MVLYRGLILISIASFILSLPCSGQKKKRSAGTHSHDLAEVIALFNPEGLHLAMKLPLINATGFEGQPSAAQKPILEKALAPDTYSQILSSPDFKKAQCGYKPIQVKLQGHGHHQDLQIDLKIQCKNTSLLKEATLNLSEIAPYGKKVKVTTTTIHKEKSTSGGGSSKVQSIKDPLIIKA